MDEKVNKELTKLPSLIQDLSFITEFNKSKDGILSERVMECHGAMIQQIDNLESDLNSILRKHEQDFLNAFKFQLYNLHTQIKELKKAANTTDLYLKHQEEVKLLQKVIDETKSESFKYEEIAEQYKVEAEKLRSKNKDLEKECKSLQTKLKKTKKLAKEQHYESTEENLQSTSKLDRSQFIEHTASKNIKNFVPCCKSGELILDLLNTHSTLDVDFLKDLEIIMEKQARHFEEASKHLKSVIVTERKRFQNYSVASTSFFSQKNDLENIFLECVEEVKRDINHRRAQSLNLQKYPTKNLRLPAVKDHILTPSDKLKIMELLITNEKVLVMLYETLFPHRASNFHSKKDMTKSQEDLPPINLKSHN